MGTGDGVLKLLAAPIRDCVGRNQVINLEDENKKIKLKEKKIKNEIKRLNGLFNNMPESTMDKVQSLIQNAAFMTVTLDELQKAINQKGMVEEYQNGANQKGFKKTVEVEIYNAMVKNQISIFKQLSELMPMDAPNPKNQEDDFIKLLKRKSM